MRPAPIPPVPPRPLAATYWVEPGRLLVGEHPGSQSRAEAMDRLRSLLRAGITCFVDLTEVREVPGYEGLLPVATPAGRTLEYVREPLPDHGVPTGREPMVRVLAAIDAALDADHVVYLHCRAGIGRSAMVAGCWLASRPGATGDPLERLQEHWRQSEHSITWPVVPETAEQAEFVRTWPRRPVSLRGAGGRLPAGPPLAARIRGALLGLAAGDAAGEARALRRPSSAGWTQHTALALCLAESLLETGRCDARDQMERFLRWQREGYLAARDQPGRASPDVARALATYQWRGLPMAGSHDPGDRSAASLSRVVSAVSFAAHDPAAAVALASECSRTTHQSPLILDACRYCAALLAGAYGGAAPEDVLSGLFEPVSGLWKRRPLRPEVIEAATAPVDQTPQRGRADVLNTLLIVRTALLRGTDAADALRLALGLGRDPALAGALTGALAGAFHGAQAIHPALTDAIPGLPRVEDLAARLTASSAAAAERGGPRR